MHIKQEDSDPMKCAFCGGVQVVASYIQSSSCINACLPEAIALVWRSDQSIVAVCWHPRSHTKRTPVAACLNVRTCMPMFTAWAAWSHVLTDCGPSYVGVSSRDSGLEGKK